MAAIHRVGVFALVLVGCDSGATPSVAGSAAVPKPTDARVVDAVTVDAGVATPDAAPTCDTVAHKFRFGTMTVPAGWCWRRTAEGDDESGIVVDAAGRVRFTYQEYGFAKTSDVCEGKRAVVARTIHGVALRTCELPNGHQCASFHGAANLCTTDVRDSDVTRDSLLQTITPRR